MLALVVLAGGAAAQDSREPAPPDRLLEPLQDVDEDDHATRFTETRWSQVFPERDYEGGCTIGFLAFEFRPNGFFIFNNRIRGNWRVLDDGNLQVRTREGLKVMLLVDGNSMRPATNASFLRRTTVYQRCSH